MATLSGNTLSGRCVLISGASGGLGETVVRAFQEAGANVAGTAREWKPGKTPERGFVPVSADLTTETGCGYAVEQAVQSFGRLDCAIHLMGGFAMDGTLEATAAETWDRMIGINAKSAFLFFKAALPYVRTSPAGRLLAVGSRAGLAPSSSLTAYAASKAALHALVQAVASELKGSAATANAIVPSTIDTAANRAAMPGADFSKWVPPAALAEALVFLAGDGAAHINGVLLPVYGGS